MIPEEKIAAVTHGLREAFGVQEFDDLRMLTKGNSTNRVFRIVVGGSPFLLKIGMRSDDPTRHYTCMTSAAEAGLAPRVRYASIEDKVFISDFVNSVPFPAFAPSSTAHPVAV